MTVNASIPASLALETDPLLPVVVAPDRWREPVVLTLSTNPGSLATTRAIREAFRFNLSSADPEYDSVNVQTLGSSSNNLGRAIATTVPIFALHQGADITTGSVSVVGPPRIASVKKIEIARVTLVTFEKATNMAGLDIARGLPSALSSAIGNSLVDAIEDKGFDCSDVDMLSTDTLDAFGHNPARRSRQLVAAQTGSAMCAWLTPRQLLVYGVNGREPPVGFEFETTAGDLTGATTGSPGEIVVVSPVSSIVQDRAAAPEIISARLDGSGAQIDIVFSTDVYTSLWTSNSGQSRSEGPCLQLFCEAVTNQLSRVKGGTRTTTAWCSFHSRRRLVMQLGPGATLVPEFPAVPGSTCRPFTTDPRQGYELLLKSGSIRTSQNALLSNSLTCTVVKPPTGSTAELRAVIAGPKVLGPCDVGRLSGSGSQGGLGRGLSFQWTLVSVNATNITST